ncbi:hypothetical protein V5799_004749 [Amblyomma americanum]|uniref:Uncharacterized protein n=1 Tax=Amblyomma americanum TaxID=6943 RepID=A0AAQ4D579_AMBAM
MLHHFCQVHEPPDVRRRTIALHQHDQPRNQRQQASGGDTRQQRTWSSVLVSDHFCQVHEPPDVRRRTIALHQHDQPRNQRQQASGGDTRQQRTWSSVLVSGGAPLAI